MTITARQAEIAANLMKIAFVDQVAKFPSKRDAAFKAASQDEIFAVIEILERLAAKS